MRASKVGVSFPAETTLEQWLAYGEALQRADSALMWLLGDWIAFGDAKKATWGKKYEEAVGATGYSYGTLRNAVMVGTALQLSDRSDKLSWTHHHVLVCGLGTEAGSKMYRKWVAIAEEHDLSKRELAASIKAGRVIRLTELQAEADKNQGLGTVHAVKTAFVRAFAQARRLRDVEQWTPQQRASWKKELKPIVDLYARL